ncbi:DUF3392 family protein [Galenea microaerophila]
MADVWQQIESNLLQLMVWFSQLLEPYFELLAFAWVATLLVIFGNDLLKWLKKQLANLGLFWRLTLFVLISAFGFSLLINYGVPFIQGGLYAVAEAWRPLLIIFAFYLLGYFAQKRGLL